MPVIMPIDDVSIPRYVIFRGKKARLVGYLPKTDTRSSRFEIIDSQDQRRLVSRYQFSFIKEKK